MLFYPNPPEEEHFVQGPNPPNLALLSSSRDKDAEERRGRRSGTSDGSL